MTPLGFALTHAWREGRAAPRRLLLLAATVALGVGALTAINGFTENLRDSIREQSRSLLGADLSVGANRALPPAVDSIVHTLAIGGAEARITSFGAMAFAPAGQTTRLVDVQAVRGAWPFYGDVVTEPAGAWNALATSRHALIDPVLLTALGVRIGDSIAIGSARFVVAGTITSLPGDIGVRTELAPRVYLPAGDLPATKLLGFGARVRYDAYVRLPVGADVRAAAAKVRPTLRALNVGLRTASEDEADLNESLTTLARYLGLVALASLLLGGIGVASASHELVARRLETVAVLRCLGASGGTVLLAYLLQAAVVGLIGGAVGAGAGTLLQLAVPHLLHDFVPVQVHVAPAPSSIALGIALGFWVTIVFALGPLLAVRRIPPLAALRRDYEPAAPSRDPWRWAAWMMTGISVVLLAALQVRSLVAGIGFALGLGLVVLALTAAAQSLIRGARRFVPGRLPYAWRQGLANLHRPANQTGAVVLALGFGAFLLVTLFLVEQSLIARFAVDAGPARPNLVFFDIQPDQGAGVDAIIREAGIVTAGSTPIVPMRIRSVKGLEVSQLQQDTVPDTTTQRGTRRRPGAWAFRREFRSTYRDSATTSERIVNGRWWHRGDGLNAAVAPVSVEESVARDLGVTVGDTIVWDVQGVDVPSRVASLRHVDWARFEPNFFVVFPRGPLDHAPQSLVTLARVKDPALRARLQRAVVVAYPNVSAIDASFLEQSVGQLVGRVTLAIRFMALFSLAAGAAVLVGAVAASRRQRLREGVLLKTLGATRGQVIRIAFAEYAALGLLAALAAMLLAVGGGWALMRFRFELPLHVSVASLIGLGLALGALSAAVGLWTGREVFQETPLEVLRAE